MPSESNLDSVTPSENPGRGIESTVDTGSGSQFDKPDRTPPAERDSGGPPEDDDDDRFQKPDRRGPTERREQRAVARESERVTVDDIQRVDDDGVTLTDSARERLVSEQFEAARERARQTADVDRISALGPFDADELNFTATEEGVEAEVADPAPAQTTTRREGPDREDFRQEAADELGVEPEAVELERTEDGFTASAEVEREQDRPLAERFESATGFEVPTQSEVLSGPQRTTRAVLGGLIEANNRASIPSQRVDTDAVPTSTTEARRGVERRFDVELPEDEAAFLDGPTGVVDDTAGSVDLNQAPDDTGDVTDAFEDITDIDTPNEAAVVGPIGSRTRGAAALASDAQEQLSVSGGEFGVSREAAAARFDTSDVIEIGRETVDTAADVNDALSAPGAGFGTIDPDAEAETTESTRTDGRAGIAAAAGTAVAVPEPTTSIGGAAVLGGLAVGAIAADTARRSELDVGGDTTEVREVEVSESDVSELQPVEQSRGTREVDLGPGVTETEVGLGDFRSTSEVSIEGDGEEPTGTPADNTVVPGEFPLPGRDVPRDRSQDAARQRSPEEFVADTLTAAPAMQQPQRQERFIEVPELNEETDIQRLVNEGDIFTGDRDPFIGERIEREFPTGAGAVIGREAARLDAAGTSTLAEETEATAFGQQTLQAPRDPLAPPVATPRRESIVDSFEIPGLDSMQGLDVGLETDLRADTITRTTTLTEPRLLAGQATTPALETQQQYLNEPVLEQLEEPLETTATATTTGGPSTTERPRLDLDGDVGDEEERPGIGFGGQTFVSPTQWLGEISEDLADSFGGDNGP